MAVLDVVPSCKQDGAPGEGEGVPPAEAAAVERALGKVGRRIIPLCMAIAMSNHMDRSNLAYAALSFNRDNGFNAKVYSMGTALFYLGFMLCMLPSNLVMMRVGTRLWLGFLLIAWGAVAASFMFVSGKAVFYALRALLGVFEAGAFPAMWHALSTFYPRNRITKPFAYLTIGIMVANMIGAPLAAGLLAMEGIGGLRGWQWLFLLEGVPSVALGLSVLSFLPGSIAAAPFLTPTEKAALEAEKARDAAGAGVYTRRQLLAMVGGNIRLWGAFLCGSLSSVASNTWQTFTPIIISNLLAGTALTNEATVAAKAGSSSLLPVALAVVPYTLASAVSYAVAHSAQRRNEHFFHVSACLLVAGAWLALFPVLARASVAGGFVSLSVSLALGAAANGPATALVARLCQGPEQVVALPLFSSFAVLGGIAGPLMAGAIMNRLGGFTWLTVVMGLMLVATGALVFGLRFYVMATGGFPDPAKARAAAEEAAAAAEGAKADAPPASPSASSGVSSSINVATVLLSQHGGKELRPRSPRAADAA